MSVHTQTRFDLDLLKRSFENWDLDTLRDQYHDDLEQMGEGSGSDLAGHGAHLPPQQLSYLPRTYVAIFPVPRSYRQRSRPTRSRPYTWISTVGRSLKLSS